MSLADSREGNKGCAAWLPSPACLSVYLSAYLPIVLVGTVPSVWLAWCVCMYMKVKVKVNGVEGTCLEAGRVNLCQGIGPRSKDRCMLAVHRALTHGVVFRRMGRRGSIAEEGRGPAVVLVQCQCEKEKESVCLCV